MPKLLIVPSEKRPVSVDCLIVTCFGSCELHRLYFVTSKQMAIKGILLKQMTYLSVTVQNVHE